ncbi:MAG: acyltransferase [Patescibacteria group bacterium]|nr:acyltransferase [Patescibacteria group bacterium]
MKKILLVLYSFLFFNIIKVKKVGVHSIIKYPFKLWNPQYLELGKDIFIAENSFFAISDSNRGQKYTPHVKVGNNVCIGSNFFLACIKSVVIEDNVLISDRVFISDHYHGFEDINTPIINQPLKHRGSVIIKAGAFIGINVVILPGVTIGKNAVVGASAVVTRSVPDFSVVAGNPAKVIRRYNKKTEKWESIK